MEERVTQAAFDIIVPVLEKAGLLAAQYSKACGRTTLTAEDLKYAMMYCARYQVGVDVGSILPEESDSDSDSEYELETVDEGDEPFTRYTGDDDLMNEINECHDTWAEWEPSNKMEEMLKDAVNKNMY
jgi:hypothetical protein